MKQAGGKIVWVLGSTELSRWLQKGSREWPSGVECSSAIGVSQYICLQYWACSQQCVSETIGAALHCQLYHCLSLLHYLKFIASPTFIKQLSYKWWPVQTCYAQCLHGVKAHWMYDSVCPHTDRGVAVYIHTQVLFYYLWWEETVSENWMKMRSRWCRESWAITDTR